MWDDIWPQTEDWTVDANFQTLVSLIIHLSHLLPILLSRERLCSSLQHVSGKENVVNWCVRMQWDRSGSEDTDCSCSLTGRLLMIQLILMTHVSTTRAPLRERHYASAALRSDRLVCVASSLGVSAGVFQIHVSALELHDQLMCNRAVCVMFPTKVTVTCECLHAIMLSKRESPPKVSF